MFTQHVTTNLRTLGVENPLQYLVCSGIPYHTVSRLFSGRMEHLTFKIMEKLCVICKCTPNELFAWSEDEGNKLPADHPLHKLKREQVGPTPIERVKNLSPEKLKKLREMLNELEKE
jgi:Cro/C1-type HTH DNA-binding domain